MIGHHGDMPNLVEPTVAVQASYLRAMAAFESEGRTADGSALGHHLEHFGGTWHTSEGFAAYVAELHRQGDPAVAPPSGWVNSSSFWLVDGPSFLGEIRIRHELTPHLLEEGGHIGYDIAPEFRRRGFGTTMLALALRRAAGLGIDPALITCDRGNVGSRRIIEANGGVLEDERHGKLRYWVVTSG